MCHAYKEKREEKVMERTELSCQESIRTHGRNCSYNWEYMMQTPSSRDERSGGSTSEQNILLQKSHQKNKYLGSLLCKIHRTILKMNKGGTRTDRPKNKEIDDYKKDLTFKR